MPANFAPEVLPMRARAPLSALVVASSQPVCPICGTVRGARLWTAACSAACRAELSRRRKAEVQRARDRKVRELLEAALRRLVAKGEEA
jgi:hypothetical protein